MPTRARRVVAVLVALAAATGASACADEDRANVEAYLNEVNGVQRRAAPAFREANEAYLRLSRGRSSGSRRSASPRALARQVRDLREAEQTIRDARGRIAAIRPPEPAAELHAAVVRVFDLNAALAAETTLLGAYLPELPGALRPLEAAGERLNDGLAQPGVAGQAAALERYDRDLSGVLRRLRELEPPPVLAPGHREQVAQLERTRALARDLERSVSGREPEAAARRLIAFRRLRRVEGLSPLAQRAIVAYGERRREILRAAGEVVRRRQALERSFEEG